MWLCGLPKLTEGDVLIKFGAVIFLFLGHVTPLFSTDTRKDVRIRVHRYFHFSLMEDQKKTQKTYIKTGCFNVSAYNSVRS